MGGLFFFSAGLALSVLIPACSASLLISGLSLPLLFIAGPKSALRKALLFLILVVLGIFAGGLRLPEGRPSVLMERTGRCPDGTARWIEGKILSSEPLLSGSKAVAETTCFWEGETKVDDKNRMLVYLPFEPPPAGAEFKASVFVSFPKEATNPGQFSYKEKLEEKGIFLVGKVKDRSLFNVTKEGRFAFLGRYRELVRNRILSSGGDEGGVILALLLGERGLIDDRMESCLVRSGLYHLVALSGFNIGMILLIIAAVFVVFRFTPASADIFAIIMLPVYGLLVGSQISVWRAILMGMMYLASRLLARPHAAFRAALMAFAALLLVNPYDIKDAGFQLTFSATLGIIVLYRHCPAVFREGTAADYAMKLFWVGFSAQVFTLPFLALYFQRVSPAGFIWTPVAALPMFPLFGLGIIYLFGGCLVPGLSFVLMMSMKFFTKLFLLVPEWSSSKSFSTLFVPLPHFIYFAAFALSLTVFILGGRRKAAGPVLLVFTMMTAYHFPDPFESGIKDSMIVLDVGQGSSQLVLYDGRAYFMDVADTSYKSVSTARTVIEPLLARLHLDRIDGVFITHWDKDHAGSIGDLCRDLPVGFAAYPACAPPPDDVAKLFKAKKVRAVPLKKGDSFTLGRASVSVLHPPGSYEGLSENDLSLVLALGLDGKKILFTGDIEKRGEEALMELPSLVGADVLIAPHHGAKNAFCPSFASSVSPAATVFSAGLNNRFNHPNRAVVDYYRSLGSRIFRTDRSGAILFSLRRDGIRSFAYSTCRWEDELWQK